MTSSTSQRLCKISKRSRTPSGGRRRTRTRRAWHKRWLHQYRSNCVVCWPSAIAAAQIGDDRGQKPTVSSSKGASPLHRQLFQQHRPKADMSGPLLLRCTAPTCYRKAHEAARGRLTRRLNSANPPSRFGQRLRVRYRGCCIGRGSYVHQYPERLAAVLLSRRLSDDAALSDCSALRRGDFLWSSSCMICCCSRASPPS